MALERTPMMLWIRSEQIRSEYLSLNGAPMMLPLVTVSNGNLTVTNGKEYLSLNGAPMMLPLVTVSNGNLTVTNGKEYLSLNGAPMMLWILWIWSSSLVPGKRGNRLSAAKV